MAERIGIRELRESLSAALRRVRDDGVSYEVTYDGEPVALLGPVPAGRLERLERAGELTRGERLASPVRRFAPQRGKPTDEIIAADRG